MRNSFVFYGSWWDAIKNLPRDVQGDVLTAIIEYGLTGETTGQLKPIAKAMLAMAKAQIDINKVRFENGKKGGRPKPNDNQTETKQEPRCNQGTTKRKPNVNGNANENANENDNVNDKGEENKNNNPPLSPDGDIPPGEPPAAVDDKDECQQTPPSPPPEKEKSSAKKEKELVARVVDYYHQRCPSLPRVKTITPGRVSAVMARIREHGKERVAEMIDHAGMSSFLAGDNNRGWTADFDWIFRPTNFVKVYEGKFDNKLPPVGQPGTGGRPHAPGRTDADHKRAERDSLNEMALAILHDAAPQDHL